MIRNVAITVTVRLLIVATALASSIITARLLGPEGRGVFFYWSTVAGISMQLGNLGLHASNTYYLAKKPELFGALATNSLICALALGFLTLALLAAVQSSQGALPLTWPLIWPTAIIAGSGLYFLFGTNLLVALDRVVEFNVFEVGNRFVAFVLIAVSAWVWGSATGGLAAAAVASLLACIPLFMRIRQLGGSLRHPDLVLFRHGIGYAMRAYFCGLAAFLVLRVGTFILERFVAPKELGTWSIAAQILDMINILPAAVGLVLLPRILRSVEPYTMMLRSMYWVAICLLGVVIGTTLLGEHFIRLLYGPAYVGAYPMLLWGLPGAISLGLLAVASQFLASAGIPRLLIGIWIVGLIVEILIALWLVPLHGPEGAMMAFSMAHIVVLALVWWLVQVQRQREHEFQSAAPVDTSSISS